jgi:hypothetical protein
MAYLQAYKDVKPVVAEIHDDDGLVGHFFGALSRQLGLKVLGSPLSGWGTNKMGFLLTPGASRAKAAVALLDFAYKELGCVHVELWDRPMEPDEARTTPYAVTRRETFEVDLSGSTEDVLARMQSRTRTYVRRASRSGLRIEEVTGVVVAEEYHRQLVDVFAASALVPTYGVDRVRALIENVGPSGQLLVLQVRDARDDPVATLLTVGRGSRATLWGLSWYRAAARLHPIEPLQWAAMQRWRERGAATYDLDGATLAKYKFGGSMRVETHLHHSRYAAIEAGRNAVKAVFYGRQRLIGRLHAQRRAVQRDRPEGSDDIDQG